MAVDGTGVGPYSAGTAFSLGLHLAPMAFGVHFQLVKGGMGGFSEAIRQSIEEKGGEVKLLTPVKRVMVENGKAIGVAVTDIVEDGLSAVYTFFDPAPEYQKQSLGVFSILWQIEEAQRRGMKWLYLGYWIKDCHKMNYKDNYQPLEYYYNHLWHDCPPGLL